MAVIVIISLILSQFTRPIFTKDMAPIMLEYYIDGLSDNEGLIAAASGAGRWGVFAGRPQSAFDGEMTL